MTRLVDMGTRYGIPILAVTAVAKIWCAMHAISACCRFVQIGATMLKPIIEDGFDTVAASCRPVVMLRKKSRA